MPKRIGSFRCPNCDWLIPKPKGLTLSGDWDIRTCGHCGLQIGLNQASLIGDA